MTDAHPLQLFFDAFLRQVNGEQARNGLADCVSQGGEQLVRPGFGMTAQGAYNLVCGQVTNGSVKCEAAVCGLNAKNLGMCMDGNFEPLRELQETIDNGL